MSYSRVSRRHGKNEQMEKRLRYGFRKASTVGLASAVLGTLVFLSPTVLADGPSSSPSDAVATGANAGAEESLGSTEDVTSDSNANGIEETQGATTENVGAEKEESQVFTVADYRASEATKQEVTVEGYITGAWSNPDVYATKPTYANLTLGDTADAAANAVIPVALPSNSAIRQTWNTGDNPDVVGKKVRVTGISETYHKTTGIKNPISIVLVEDTPETSPTNPDSGNTTNPEGSTESETDVLQPSEASTPLVDVRAGEQGKVYTVTGKLISKPNSWGGNGFYIQDNSGSGLYVYPGANQNVQEGDTVQLTGTLGQYGGELQLTNVTETKKVSDEITPTLTEAQVADLTDDLQSTLVKLTNMEVTNVNEGSSATTLTLKDASGATVDVRVDNRSGVTGSDILGLEDNKIGQGDTVTITGILSTYNGKNQVKPFSLEHFQVVKKTETPVAENVLTVGQIQGESHTSPHLDETVVVKEVVVTYLDGNNRFYVQDIVPDGNVKTSDGINVYLRNHGVQVGDKVEIVAKVTEYFGDGYAEKKETDLAITQLAATKVTKVGTADVPAPVVIGRDRIVPLNIIDNDGFADFDPEEDALDFWESLEGMIVAIDDAKVIGPMTYGTDIYVVPGDSTAINNKYGGISVLSDAIEDNNASRIHLKLEKKSSAITPKTGDRLFGRVQGPVSYSYTDYNVMINPSSVSIIDGGVTATPTTIVKDEKKLTVASYNIENFSANTSSTSDAKVARIAKSFVEELNAPDIITVIEMQDNNGETNDGTTDANQSAQRLIDAIVAAGGPTYQYIDIAPENNMDGGAGGANIRTGYLYNKDRVKLTDKPVGDANTAISFDGNGELSHSVGRIDPTNELWASTRKPLVAEFELIDDAFGASKGEKVVMVSIHLNSKRGDNGLFGSVQPVTFKSEEKRHQLSALLADFVKSAGDANILMMGDYNDYEYTKTIQIVEEAGMQNLVSLHPENDRFSYFYNGTNQSLDNMLISKHLLEDYQFDMVHVNSLFMEEHGRASDHDPLLAQLTIPAKVATFWLDAEGVELQDSQKGTKEAGEIEGYSFVETKTVDGNTHHIFERLVMTSWLDADGNELQPSKIGHHESGELANYTLAGTRIDDKGNISYIFKATEQPPVEEVPEKTNPGELVTLVDVNGTGVTVELSNYEGAIRLEVIDHIEPLDLNDTPIERLVGLDYDIYDIVLVDQDGNLVTDLDFVATVRLPYDKGKVVERIVYLPEVGESETLAILKQEDGFVYFEANHFSHYGVIYAQEKEPEEIKDTPIELIPDYAPEEEEKPEYIFNPKDFAAVLPVSETPAPMAVSNPSSGQTLPNTASVAELSSLIAGLGLLGYAGFYGMRKRED